MNGQGMQLGILPRPTEAGSAHQAAYQAAFQTRLIGSITDCDQLIHHHSHGYVPSVSSCDRALIGPASFVAVVDSTVVDVLSYMSEDGTIELFPTMGHVNNNNNNIFIFSAFLLIV